MSSRLERKKVINEYNSRYHIKLSFYKKIIIIRTHLLNIYLNIYIYIYIYILQI